jgi:hypothetical protein
MRIGRGSTADGGIGRALVRPLIAGGRDLWRTVPMADEAPDPIRARMQSLTDDELVRVVTVEAGDWEPEALAAAREEMARRERAAPDLHREVPGGPTGTPPAPEPADRHWPRMKKSLPVTILIVLGLRLLALLLSKLLRQH